MSNYDDDELDEVEGEETPVEEEAASNGNGNRNFLVALGILGGIFLLLIIGLVALFLTRQSGGSEAANIQRTNDAIFAANTQTAGAATQLAALLLTPSVTPIPSDTPVPPTPTNTQVVALATNTLSPEELETQVAQGIATFSPEQQSTRAAFAELFTVTASPTFGRTGTIEAALTQAAEQTQVAAGQSTPGFAQTRTQAAVLTATATRLPNSGFADDVGLPGLFGMALGLVVLIVLVRRMRLSTGS
jgi:hypothetical protein